MTACTRDLLSVFEKLAPEDKQAVAVEILRRSLDDGALPETELAELASKLLKAYDAEECGPHTCACG